MNVAKRAIVQSKKRLKKKLNMNSDDVNIFRFIERHKNFPDFIDPPALNSNTANTNSAHLESRIL